MALTKAMLDELVGDCKTPQEMEKLYSQMLQHMINRSLEAEMQAHLAVERNQKSGGNPRNGKSRKVVQSTMGELEIETPRDREGTFDAHFAHRDRSFRLIVTGLTESLCVGVSVRQRSRWGVGFGFSGRSPAHGFALERDAMGAVDETVEDGIGDGGIVEPGVPVLDRQLAGDDGGLAGGAVVDDVEQVVAGGVIERVMAQSSRMSTSMRASCASVRPKLPSAWAMRSISESWDADRAPGSRADRRAARVRRRARSCRRRSGR